jgi:hypothetical protein
VPYRQRGNPTWWGCKEFERKKKIEAGESVAECLSQKSKNIYYGGAGLTGTRRNSSWVKGEGFGEEEEEYGGDTEEKDVGEERTSEEEIREDGWGGEQMEEDNNLQERKKPRVK